MKRLFLILLLCVPCLLQAGIIVTKNNNNIDNVTNIKIGETEITYEQDGQAKSISKDKVSAILYDDGRYEEIQTIHMQNREASYENNNYINSSATNQVYSQQWYFGYGGKIYYREGSTQVACNVIAYGNNKRGVYTIDHACDSVRIEYRVFYNNQSIEPDWKYLGTTPFVCLTNSAQQNPFFPVDFNISSKINPLVIDNVHLSVRIEFRLSKEGYKSTTIVPIVIFDKPDYSNIYYMLFLKPLKPLRGKDASKSMNTETNDSPSNTSIKMDPSDASSPKKMIPQICYTEGKNAYDAVYKEGQIQAVRRGYSKTQAISIAGEFAEQAKQKAIDECYKTIVVHDEEFALGSSSASNTSESFFEIYELSSSAKQMMPQACTEEGKKAYDAAYAEAEIKALRQGYSKSQAKTIASEAAENAKNKAIDECYDNVVNKGQDYYSAEDITVLSTTKPVKQDTHKPVKQKNTKLAKEEQHVYASEQSRPTVIYGQPANSSEMITKISNKEYQVAGNTMDMKAYENFIKQNCPEAWKKHRQADKTIKAGWSFFTMGIALTSMWGLLGVEEYSSYYGYYRTPPSAELSAIILGSFGAGFTALSFPLLGAGYHKKHNTYKVYNNHCTSSQRTPMSLNFKADQDGLGFALHF